MDLRARADDAELVRVRPGGRRAGVRRAVRPLVEPGARRRLPHRPRPGGGGRGRPGRLPGRLDGPRRARAGGVVRWLGAAHRAQPGAQPPRAGAPVRPHGRRGDDRDGGPTNRPRRRGGRGRGPAEDAELVWAGGRRPRLPRRQRARPAPAPRAVAGRDRRGAGRHGQQRPTRSSSGCGPGWATPCGPACCGGRGGRPAPTWPERWRPPGSMPSVPTPSGSSAPTPAAVRPAPSARRDGSPPRPSSPPSPLLVVAPEVLAAVRLGLARAGVPVGDAPVIVGGSEPDADGPGSDPPRRSRWLRLHLPRIRPAPVRPGDRPRSWWRPGSWCSSWWPSSSC